MVCLGCGCPRRAAVVLAGVAAARPFRDRPRYLLDHISVTVPNGRAAARRFGDRARFSFQNANACRNMFWRYKKFSFQNANACIVHACTVHARVRGARWRCAPGRHCAACAPPRPRSLPCALRTSTRVHRALGTRAARVRAPRRRRPCSHTATHACTSKAGCDA